MVRILCRIFLYFLLFPQLPDVAYHERTHILVLPQVVGLGLAKIAQVAQGEFVAADGDAEG